MRANEFATSVWLNGPAWLRKKEPLWPKATTQHTIVEETLEITQVVTLMPFKPLEIQWQRFSSWTKLVHSICYILRCKSLNQIKGSISLDEYQEAEQMMISLVQKEAFPTDYAALTENKELSSKSSIAQLCPFIDDNGIMRARGRLSKADFEFDIKHPILLPAKHFTMQLMIKKCHLDNCHQDVESMLHELQQKFWIFGLRNAIRSLKSRCVPCRKYSTNV